MFISKFSNLLHKFLQKQWCVQETKKWHFLKYNQNTLGSADGHYKAKWYSLLVLCPAAAAAAKSRQLCPTRCNPIDGSPPGSPVPGILQARTLEWVAISFSKGVVSNSLRPHGLQPTRFLCPWDFPGKSTGVGCHRLLWCPNEYLILILECGISVKLSIIYTGNLQGSCI